MQLPHVLARDVDPVLHAGRGGVHRVVGAGGVRVMFVAWGFFAYTNKFLSRD